MSFICNFTNDSDCSSLFEQVHVSFTAIQATLAIIIVLTSIPVNLLLIAAMIFYRKSQDKSIIISISVLISNTIVSVFLTGEIAITSIARSWLFGYWGCQIIAFIGTSGWISGSIAVGLVSFDRLCRVFWPFAYQRHEKKIIVTLLITSWTIAIIISTFLWLYNSYDFAIAIPGCVIIEAPDISVLETIVVYVVLAASPILGLLFPGIIYTIMYCKARKLRQKTQIGSVMAESPDMASAKEAQRRANRATLTYVLMMVVLIVVKILIITDIIVRVILHHLNVSTSIIVPIGFWFTIFICSYVLGDVVIILTDKQQRNAVKKLLSKLKNKIRNELLF